MIDLFVSEEFKAGLDKQGGSIWLLRDWLWELLASLEWRHQKILHQELVPGLVLVDTYALEERFYDDIWSLTHLTLVVAFWIGFSFTGQFKSKVSSTHLDVHLLEFLELILMIWPWCRDPLDKCFPEMMAIDLLCCVVDKVASQRVRPLGLLYFKSELLATLFFRCRSLTNQAVVGLTHLICRALIVAIFYFCFQRAWRVKLRTFPTALGEEVPTNIRQLPAS